jgi:hypothetical protein
MDIEAVLKEGAAGWQRQETPASSDTIANLNSASPIKLPNEYLALLRFSNGGEGELGVGPGWFQIWPAEKVIEYNQDYEIAKNVPGFYGFGSNGGGELLAFDTRAGEPWKIVMVPFILMQQEDAVTIADNFGEFVRALGRVLDDP